MGPEGVLILNADDAMYPRARQRADDRGLSVVTFSHGRSDADVYLVHCQDGIGDFTVTAFVCGQTVTYRVPGFADHLVPFSLGVAAVLAILGADFVPLMAGFDRSFVVPEGRGRLHHIPYGGGVIHVIDDSYNAGPDSMIAAFQTLSKLAGKTGGRALAVLGDMGELGPNGPAIHRGLKTHLERLKINRVYTSGPLMRGLFDGIIAAMRGHHDDQVLGLMPSLLADVRPGDVILVKGSKGQYAERGRMYAITHGLLTLKEQG